MTEASTVELLAQKEARYLNLFETHSANLRKDPASYLAAQERYKSLNLWRRVTKGGSRRKGENEHTWNGWTPLSLRILRPLTSAYISASSSLSVVPIAFPFSRRRVKITNLIETRLVYFEFYDMLQLSEGAQDAVSERATQ
jgi:hypothetical protein